MERLHFTLLQGPQLPEGFWLNPALNGRSDEQPLFRNKVDRANHILRTMELPKNKMA